MPRYTFDTNFIVQNKLSDIPDNFLFSDVVLLELIRSSQDETEFKKYQALRKKYLKEDLLIIPNSDDWEMAGKVLNWIERGIARKNKGRPPKKAPGETQRMVMDALIAISSRRYKGNSCHK